MNTVLLVDSDLGFIFWLGQALDREGYAALPAKSIPDAISLLAELRISIDVLVVNPLLAGAAEWIALFRDSQEHVKVVALLGFAENMAAGDLGADAALAKPAVIDEISQLECLQVVNDVLMAAPAISGREF